MEAKYKDYLFKVPLDSAVSLGFTHLELLDKCQGRDFVLFEGNGLLEHIIDEFTDLEHGGQFLHSIYLLDNLIRKMRHFQMRFDFVFFMFDDEFEIIQNEKEFPYQQAGIDKDNTVCSLLSENTSIWDVEIRKNGNVLQQRFTLLKRSHHSSLKKLLRIAAIQHLRSLGFKCHEFCHWNKSLEDKIRKSQDVGGHIKTSDQWMDLLDAQSPAFVIISKKSHLLRMHISVVCQIPTIHTLEIHYNTLYGFRSSFSLYKNSMKIVKEDHESALENFLQSVEVNSLEKPLFDDISQFQKEIGQYDSDIGKHLALLSYAMKFSIKDISESSKLTKVERESTKIHLFNLATGFLISTSQTYTCSLEARSQRIDFEDDTILQFLNYIHNNLYRILKNLPIDSCPIMTDLIDGRLFYKVMQILCDRTEPITWDLLQDWIEKENRSLIQKQISLIAEHIGVKPSTAISFKSDFLKNMRKVSITAHPQNKTTQFAMHPLTCKLTDAVFSSEQFQLHSPEESTAIITRNVEGFNADKQKIYQDDTHWKSQQLLTEDTGFMESENSQLHRESLARYAKVLKANQVVYLNEEIAAEKCEITDDILENLETKLKDANEISSLSKVLDEMLDKWILNIRIQSLEGEKYEERKNRNRAELLSLIRDTLLKSLEYFLEKNNHIKDNKSKASMIRYAKAIVDVFDQAYISKDEIYKKLLENDAISKFVHILLRFDTTHNVATGIIKKFQLDIEITGCEDQKTRKAQFVETQTPTFVSLLFPTIIVEEEHSSPSISSYFRHTVLEFSPDDWQKEVISHVNHNLNPKNDEKRSVLVSVPTSGGKTFIIMYLIERILKGADKNARIVFVLPTIPLCNQVYAEIFNKFKYSPDDNSNDEMEIVGMFTARFRIGSAQKCRVLVTNPACLEILLLSNSSNVWRESISHVVLDEVHHISDEDSGAYWEHILALIRCPFIALSGTMGNPFHFQKWLNSISSSRTSNKTEVVLVPSQSNESQNSHSFHKIERVQPLEFFTYIPPVKGSMTGKSDETDGKVSDKYGKIQRIHPLSALNMKAIDEKNIENKQQSSSEQIQELLKVSKNIENIQQFSSEQIQELLEVSKNISNSDDPLSEFHIDKQDQLFDEYGVIDMKSFHLYKKDLMEKLKNLLKDRQSWFKKLVEELKAPFSDSIKEIEKRRTDLYETTTLLIFHMKYKQMLPALIFHFNKNGIAKLVKDLIIYMLNNGLQLVDCYDSLNSELSHIDYFEGDKFVLTINEMDSKKKDDMKKKLNELFNIDNHVSSENGFVVNLPVTVEVKNETSYQRRLINFEKIVTWMKEKEIEYKFSLNIQSDSLFHLALRFGIGIHHNSIDEYNVREVERLFRMKLLPVCFATGTLAFGISMPCKTTVLADESMYLTTNVFFQCSGRAGRRGYDPIGNVILLNLSQEKICRYLASEPPNLNGSMGSTVSFILRLMIYYSTSMSKSENQEIHNKVLEDCKTVLEQPLINFGSHKSQTGNNQNIHYVRFALNFLRHEGYLDHEGNPIGFCPIPARIFYAEPSPFLFVVLLRNKIFDKVFSCCNGDMEKSTKVILQILAGLFVRRKSYATNERRLPPLDKILAVEKPPNSTESSTFSLVEVYEKYNNSVLELLKSYIFLFASSKANELRDNSLPFSEISIPRNLIEESSLCKILKEQRTKNIATSNFCALSGNTDNFVSVKHITQSLKHTIAIDTSLIPTVDLSCFDEGICSYIVDYFEHREASIIVEENYFLNEKKVFDDIYEFNNVIKKILNFFPDSKELKDDRLYKVLTQIKIALLEPTYRNEKDQEKLITSMMKEYKDLVQPLIEQKNVENNILLDKCITYYMYPGHKDELMQQIEMCRKNLIEIQKELCKSHEKNGKNIETCQKGARILNILSKKVGRLPFQFEAKRIDNLLEKLEKLKNLPSMILKKNTRKKILNYFQKIQISDVFCQK